MTRHTPQLFAAALALLLLVALAPRARAATPQFSDIGGLWDAGDVTHLAALGIINGEPGGRFAPSQPLTRAALAALMQRSLSLPAVQPSAPPFADVPAGSWMAPAVSAVKQAGWMDGVGGGLFLPDQSATRVQAVTVLARALQLPAAPVAALPFRDDGTVPDWGRPTVAAAVYAGLVSGYPDGTFRPDQVLDRAAAAHLLALAYARAHPPQPPAAPAGVYLTSYRDHVDVVWSAVDGAASYTVQRQTPGGAWQDAGTTQDHVWGDYGAQPTVPYAYRVVATGLNGLVSAPSASVSEPALTAQQTGWVAPFGFSVATQVGLGVAIQGGPGTPLGLGGLKLASLPALTVTTANGYGPTLLLSDSPETVSAPAVLYQAPATGAVRAFFDHINATGAAARFALVLSNPGPAVVSYSVQRATEVTSGGPKAQGQAVAGALLSSAQPAGGGTLPPGQAVSLDPAGTVLANGDAILGDYELSLTGQARLAFLLVPANQDPVALYRAGRLVQAAVGDGSGRGTFTGTLRNITLAPPGAQPAAVRLADGVQDTYLSGTDATTGRPAVDNGNYGVIYHLQGRPTVRTALLAVPVGGGYLGVLGSGGQLYPAPTYVLDPDGASGFLVAVWDAGQQGEVYWTPPAGSFLPLELVSIPLG